MRKFLFQKNVITIFEFIIHNSKKVTEICVNRKQLINYE